MGRPPRGRQSAGFELFGFSKFSKVESLEVYRSSGEGPTPPLNPEQSLHRITSSDPATNLPPPAAECILATFRANQSSKQFQLCYFEGPKRSLPSYGPTRLCFKLQTMYVAGAPALLRHAMPGSFWLDERVVSSVPRILHLPVLRGGVVFLFGLVFCGTPQSLTNPSQKPLQKLCKTRLTKPVQDPHSTTRTVNLYNLYNTPRILKNFIKPTK